MRAAKSAAAWLSEKGANVTGLADRAATSHCLAPLRAQSYPAARALQSGGGAYARPEPVSRDLSRLRLSVGADQRPRPIQGSPGGRRGCEHSPGPSISRLTGPGASGRARGRARLDAPRAVSLSDRRVT